MKQIQDGLFKDSVDVLVNAFEKQYESRTQDPNRNKGLPFIKRTHDEKKFKNLVVSTNDIFYNFEQKEKSATSLRNATNFSGTFYQWESDKQCIKYYD